MERLKSIVDDFKSFFFVTEQDPNYAKGINSTYATVVANMSEEIYKSLMSKLENIHFVNEYKDIIGTDSDMKQTKVASTITVEQMKEIALKCGRLHRLQAWLREAVKERDKAKEAIKRINIIDVFDKPVKPEKPEMLKSEEACEILGIEMPTRPELLSFTEWFKKKNITLPEVPILTEYTVESVIAKMSLKEYEEYIGNNSMAAVLGKLVHDDGPIKRAFNEHCNAIANPRTADGCVITAQESMISPEEADSIIPIFLSAHKKYERRKNGIAKSIKNKVMELQVEENHRYNQAMQEYQTIVSDYRNKMSDEYDAAVAEYSKTIALIDKTILDKHAEDQEEYTKRYNEYNAKMVERENNFNEYVININKFINSFKIVIPNEILNEFKEIDSELSKE